MWRVRVRQGEGGRDGSGRSAKGFGHGQLPPFMVTLLPPSVLSLAALEGKGKTNPSEELAITRLSKRPPWKKGQSPPQTPASHPYPFPTTLCPSHPPQTCQRILFYTSCLSVSSLSEVYSPSGLRKVSSK